MDSFHNIEAFLRTAPILFYGPPPLGGGAHQEKFTAVLAGGSRFWPSHRTRLTTASGR